MNSGIAREWQVRLSKPPVPCEACDVAFVSQQKETEKKIITAATKGKTTTKKQAIAGACTPRENAHGAVLLVGNRASQVA